MRKRSVSLLFVLGLSALTLSANSPTDRAVEQALSRDLAKYPGVTVQVEDRVATLAGTVEKFTDKQAAERKARGYGAVTSVVNRVSVAGATVPDEELAAAIARRLSYDRSFQDSVFNWFTVAAENGKVSVKGFAYSYPARDSALARAASTSGVKDLVDEIEVLPTSRFDDEIRILAARRIYGGITAAAAIDPAHPVRIVVKHGHVTLEGFVNTQVEKQMAESRLFGLSGVFSVTNNLTTNKS